MAQETQSAQRHHQPHGRVEGAPLEHELFTRMLFADALVGLGIPLEADGPALVGDGLAEETFPFYGDPPVYVWVRSALEALPVNALQACYLAVKYDAVISEDGGYLEVPL